MIEEAFPDAVHGQAVNLIIYDHATTRVRLEGLRSVRFLLSRGGTLIVEVSRKYTREVLHLLVGCVVWIETLGVRCPIASGFAAELHAR